MSRTTQVNQYQKVHFAIFWILWCKMKITQADAPTSHPVQTNWCPHLCFPTIFMQDALPYTTLPIYPGLGQAPNMLACICGGLVGIGLSYWHRTWYTYVLLQSLRMHWLWTQKCAAGRRGCVCQHGCLGFKLCDVLWMLDFKVTSFRRCKFVSFTGNHCWGTTDR